jgi:hypothetical protein
MGSFAKVKIPHGNSPGDWFIHSAAGAMLILILGDPGAIRGIAGTPG